MNAIAAYLANIPTVVLLIAAGAAFGIAVRWRWRWCYLIDLALIAGAITHLTIGAIAWIAVIFALRHVPAFARDLAALADLDSYDGLTLHLGWLLLPGAAPPPLIMSRSAEGQTIALDQSMAVSAPETNDETAETPQRVAETLDESFTFGETEALARLVASGKLGLTDAVKIGAGAKSGEKYQRRSREIKEAVDALKNHFPQRTPDQQQQRDKLGIPKP